MEIDDTNEHEENRSVRKVRMLQREVRRVRNSVSFRLGTHLTNAIRKPWKLLFLPITFPIRCLQIGLERIGKKPTLKSGFDDSNEIVPRNNSIVLFPTNGVGFGHFTRMYAIALELQKQEPKMEIIFFTTMPTLHIPYVDNFSTYHLAGRKKYNDMTSSTWNMLVEEMLTLIFETHNPKYFMFDGAYPYRGMLNAIYGRAEIQKIWMRRGMFRKGASIPVDSIEHFDLVAHPGDAMRCFESEISHKVETIQISPITLFQSKEMLPREDAKMRLNLPIDVNVTYVQLGAGQINDIDSEVSMVVEALLEHEDMHIVIGESMLGERLNISNDRIHILRDYPNVLYFNAFDYSIQAGGYNSFHEMRIACIPTLFLPNMNTGMDDQKARCDVAVSEGWGVVNIKRDPKSISKDINKLILHAVNKKDTPIDENNGALELINHLF